MQFLKQLNSHKHNPFYPKHFLQKIIDIFITLFKILKVALKNPIGFIKQFSFSRIRILLKAISHENPDQISKNLSYLLKHKYIDDSSKIMDPISKENHHKLSQENLSHFLNSNSRIKFDSTKADITIILVLFNKANLTYACLRSIERYTQMPLQLILVDNNSTDKTKQLLNRLDGVEIIYNKENLHFVRACNQTINLLTTPYLLFLNNDIELFEGSLDSLYSTLKSDEKIGAVGGKIIGLDGKLLEAGSIIWNDGSCLGYGREESLDLFNHSFNRVVDYCSGAFILTKTELFKEHGGYDERFIPAYFEETDYCMWLYERGYKCVYDANAKVRHVEFGSSGQEEAILLQTTNQLKFSNKHCKQLKNHFDNNNTNIINARFAASQQECKKILYIEDRIPHRSLGVGFTRSNEIVNKIQKLGYQVTIFPMYRYLTENWEEVYKDLFPFIEIIKEGHYLSFEEFIKARSEYYDIIWVTRPHNMDIVYPYIFKYAQNYRLIYDAEAIFSERMKLDLKFNGIAISDKSLLYQTKKEVILAMKADLVITVSMQDAKKFNSFSIEHIRVLGHCLKKTQTANTFANRKNLLFVGNLDIDFSPNVDSVHWFIKNVFPLIKQKLPDIKFNIIGSNEAPSLKDIEEKDIIFHGNVNNLQDSYDQNRVFIAPTRFAAGIPYKVHEAAAHGIPIVATNLLGKQLNWDHRKEILLSSLDPDEFSEMVIELYQDQELWESVQKNAHHFVKNELDEASYEKQIINILNFKD